MTDMPPCLRCGKPVKRLGKTYCSKGCASRHAGEIRRSQWPWFTCQHCGKSFQTWPHLQGKQRFCSMKCKRAEDVRNLQARTGSSHPGFIKSDVTCWYCGKTFHRPPSLKNGKKAFCSQECRHAYGTVTIICKQCGKEVEVQRNLSDKVFCNKNCYGEWLSENRSGEAHPRWKGGWEPYYGADWKRQRELCRQRDNSTCRICGVTGDQVGSENIDVHHIVSYKASRDNSLGNLVCLCDSCHHKVENGTIECPTNADHIAAVNIRRRAAVNPPNVSTPLRVSESTAVRQGQSFPL